MKFLFHSFVYLLFIAGCSDLVDHQSLHPKKDKIDLKEIAQPVANVQRESLQKFHPYKKKIEQENIPKALLKPVSVIITEQTPVKEVLTTLAEQTGVELQLATNINLNMIYTAKKKPFYHVIKQICDIGNLRLTRDGTSLRIEIDTPYTKNYNVQFLNIERDSQNRISIATDVFGTQSPNLGQGKTANLDNGSNSEVKAQGQNNFWGEVAENLKIILSHTEKAGKFSIHKQAGLISIFATQRQHDLIKDYLEQLKHITSRQVLVEAKIIEVTLKDGYKSGINWQKLGGGDLITKANFGSLASSAPFLDTAFAGRDALEFGGKGSQFSGILQALEEFGSSRTLSSPRLTVMNNQTALLKVAQNHVYFRINYDKQTSAQNNIQNFNLSSDIQTVPIGLVMSVQPSIDDETGDVILFLRPTISKLSQTVADPAVDLALAANNNNNAEVKQSLVPVVDVKEMDTILRVKSGDVGILGGLMEVKSTQNQANLPGSGDMPFIKDIFGSHAESDEVVELVILLKVTIVNNAEPDAADKRMIKTHFTDARPL
jgi:MSHA type pilus biogenesis protein MshL